MLGSTISIVYIYSCEAKYKLYIAKKLSYTELSHYL